MVRTGNVDFSCKRLTSIEIRKSKYHIIRRVRFRWDPPPPPRKLSGSALGAYTMYRLYDSITLTHRYLLSIYRTFCLHNGFFLYVLVVTTINFISPSSLKIALWNRFL